MTTKATAVFFLVSIIYLTYCSMAASTAIATAQMYNITEKIKTLDSIE